MSVWCAACQIPGVGGVCPDCGASCVAAGGAEELDPDAVVLRQCPFRTGAWQCRLMRQAKAAQAFCEVHRQSLRDQVRDLPGMLAVLLAHREEAQATRRPEGELPLEQQKAWRLAQLVEGVSAEEAFDRIGYRPFHWRSVEECWQLLTGQTVLPEGAERIMQEGRR